MPVERDQFLYVAVDTRGKCQTLGPSRRPPAASAWAGAVEYLGQLLEQGWQLVSESPAGQSESSVVLLRRQRP